MMPLTSFGQTESVSPCRSCFVDTDGEVRDAERAYRELLDTGQPNRLRASLELLLLLGGGTAWYWIDDRNVLDWDSPSARERFTGRAWALDNNGFPMNFVLHPLAGSAYYGIARANQLGVAEAAAYSLLTSFVWEYAIEFKEKISINDSLVTPGGGIVLGEFFHKLGWYLNTSPDYRPHTAFEQKGSLQRFLFGPSVSLHRAWDGLPEKRQGAPDRLGYSRDIFHEFDLGYAFGAAGNRQTPELGLHRLRFRGQLVSIPGYLRPGRLARFFHRADFSELSATVEASPAGSGLDLKSNLVLAGYLAQRLDLSSSGLFGHATVFGSSMAFRYLNTRARDANERLSVLHFPGLHFDSRIRSGQLFARVKTHAHADFAGIQAFSYPAWQAAHPTARTKSILRKQGYYYAWGASVHGSLDLGWGPLQTAFTLSYGFYDSQEGRDRTQESVTADVDLEERVLEYTAAVKLRTAELSRFPLSFGLRYGTRRWISKISDFSEALNSKSVELELSTSF